jgi:protein-tyrosine phosphatase
MKRILMICHGNICRSTMAEYVMRHLVAQHGATDRIAVDSAAATRDAEGWGVHHKTQEVLRCHNVPCGNHRSRQMTRADYKRYDIICGMDEENRIDILHILGGVSRRSWHWETLTDTVLAKGDPEGKVHLLLDWSSDPREIADPWYTNDFETTYRDVLEGCEGLLAAIEEGRA